MMKCESEMEGMSEEYFFFFFSFLRNFQGSEETLRGGLSKLRVGDRSNSL